VSECVLELTGFQVISTKKLDHLMSFVPIKYGKRPPRAERLIRMSEDKLTRRGGEYGMGSGNVQECTQEQLPEMTKNLC
jgi:hypothetical protein